MDKVLKRVSHHKKHTTSSTAKARDNCNGVPSSSINKRYSVDDNFYTYVNRNDLHENCDGSNYYTISNRGDLKRNTIHRSRFNNAKQLESNEKQVAREDAAFKKFLRVFNTGENSRGAKDWIANSANNMMDFAPRIFTRRSKKGRENELYRSNSFKFERFERTDSDTLNAGKKSPVTKQVSLCDDYSLPVDFVNKRPLSLDSGSFWSAPSPNGDQVEVLNLYCDPKDSAKNQQPVAVNDPNASEEHSAELEEKLKLYSVVHKEPKEYCRPYKESSDDGEREDDDTELYENLKHRKLTSASAHSAQKGGTYTEVRKSPYYYGDLVKRCQREDNQTNRRGCNSSREIVQSKHENQTKDHQYENTSVNNSFDIQEEDEDEEFMAGKQRHLYETAFDSKICRSNETLDVDVVANHMMERYSPQLPYNPAFCNNVSKDNKCSLKRLKNAKNKLNLSSKYESSVDNISQHLTDLDISDQNTLLQGYSSASTSTIPLPQSVSSTMNDSCESFSESSNPKSRTHSESFFQEVQKRVNNNCSPIYANNIAHNNNNNNNNNHNNRNKNIKNIKNINNYRHQDHRKQKPSICCRNGECCSVDNHKFVRPTSCQLNGKILEIKGRPRQEHGAIPRRFSSNESMTTCSSDGSLESIRSSTSEGNRSTTSTDSRHSSSLSSHSSDSAVGNGSCFAINFQLGNRFANQNKMHVLSPISDKSFQEAGSEGSEVNRNSNSQKVSPDEGEAVSPDGQQSRSKRRAPQNKNLSNLTNIQFASNKDVEAHQCSDSGISIESRSDTQKMNQTADLGELPFDMPKLRRRRLQQMQLTQSTQDTSSSATSIDLKDLPFDMPKLRRKLRSSSTQDSTDPPSDTNVPGLSAAPDEFAPETTDKPPAAFDLGRNRRSLGLSLNLSEILPPTFNIDTDLPLERQGWYHGAITRMEAEHELRNREEGSYLVRNSESAKNDFSLSLKSAKGFMHMRIQKAVDANKFVLGQFSSPFNSIPEMIKHYSSNQLPIRGAEHMCLLQPVIAQFL